MNQSTPIKHKLRPFENSTAETITMYDHFPYDRDINLCTKEMITLVTGNVIKYFQCRVGEVLPLEGMDELFLLKYKEYQLREQLALEERSKPQEEDTKEEELTMEEVPKKELSTDELNTILEDAGY